MTCSVTNLWPEDVISVVEVVVVHLDPGLRMSVGRRQGQLLVVRDTALQPCNVTRQKCTKINLKIT